MRVQRAILTRVTCTATLVVVGLAGGVTTQDSNGIEDLPANEIMEKAADATKSADSLRLKGTTTSGPDEVLVDLALNEDGDCKGTIGPRENVTAEIIKVGDAAYLKGDETFWKEMESGSDEVDLLADQWLKVSAQSEGFEDLAELCDADRLLQDIPDHPDPGLTKGKIHDVNDQPAIPVVRKDDGVTSTVDVATEGEPYILRLSRTGGDEPADLVMSDYNKPVNAEAPPAEDVLDIEDLQ
ncbi:MULTISPECIES: hypothetical protein [Streptomyces]|uniref:Lipoprotein n=1 Tax=Streptomyces chartreusis NRRL 3882 TaxID=1079985 RepID=A0A2N9BBI2_STRCX|nr:MULTISPECIES: hypothetical protein [Streptomyces]MYS91589.1 hypothetical protein [Streptomyces sp. SID5464]SOR80706.1 hypothetical protein SCNRRL3882_4160 [Streptomyces chartreusis NRRL 3882]